MLYKRRPFRVARYLISQLARNLTIVDMSIDLPRRARLPYAAQASGAGLMIAKPHS